MVDFSDAKQGRKIIKKVVYGKRSKKKSQEAEEQLYAAL